MPRGINKVLIVHFRNFFVFSSNHSVAETHLVLLSCKYHLGVRSLVALCSRAETPLEFIVLFSVDVANAMPFLNLPSLTAGPSVGRSEYGRVKVALPPGKGLMDWVRLTSGKILAKKKMSVSHNELMKHNKNDDCWVHIFGQVYDVTSYLEFHPGGIPELMRAAGTDATDLFNQNHAWVNYENMLKSCFVGRFTGDLSKLPQPGPCTIDQSKSISAQLNALITKDKQNNETYGIVVTKNAKEVKLVSDEWNSSNVRLANVVVDVSPSKKLIRVVVRTNTQPVLEVKWGNVAFNSDSYTYEITVKDGSITISFESTDISAALASANQSIKQSPLLAYHECIVEEKRPLSHDTLLFVFRLSKGLFFPVATGRHVSFKIRKGGTDVNVIVFTAMLTSKLYRPYTPVNCGSLSEVPEDSESIICREPTKIIFMIKVYSQGICTPSLEQLNVGDSIEISEPIGNAELSSWTDTNNGLLMLAAGTGLTPMVNVLAARLRKMVDRGSNLCNTQLLLFNKTENDIVSDEWLPMRWSDERVTVEHILSDPSPRWTGRVGRIKAEMLPVPQESLRVLICGPDGFIITANKLLLNAGYSKGNIHVFQG